MAEFYVERQVWARWPKVLIMCRRAGSMEGGDCKVEQRCYVPKADKEAVKEILGGYLEEAHALYRAQKEALYAACRHVAECTGSCPYDVHYDECADWKDDCENSCSAETDYAECWMRYFTR